MVPFFMAFSAKDDDILFFLLSFPIVIEVMDIPLFARSANSTSMIAG